MAAIPVNTPKTSAETVISKLDLNGGPHTFTYNAYSQYLAVDNGESGTLTVNLLGVGVTSAICSGLGPIDVSAGYDFTLATGTEEKLQLTTRGGYLGAANTVVDVTVTGATGLSFGWIEQY
jgi:hypothetical protein